MELFSGGFVLKEQGQKFTSDGIILYCFTKRPYGNCIAVKRSFTHWGNSKGAIPVMGFSPVKDSSWCKGKELLYKEEKSKSAQRKTKGLKAVFPFFSVPLQPPLGGALKLKGR